ncbi:GNAT family N-acetyltransferase [Leminorella grimontii]|uniref:GNAT family N-acetyltransferase n=1 Tax=Leminorella grimontii TaxID=82981 RepID=UPI002083760A|nr:hypothetical protein [Leminorella grimontii]GKX58081.1 hypothetical protein SOASR031_03960 [Leminorella grimontii]
MAKTAKQLRYLRARPEDYLAILEIAEPFYPDVNNHDGQKGFLDRRFSAPMLDAINTRLGLLVAKDENHFVLGFLGLSPFSFDSPSPVVEAMVKALQPCSAPVPFIFGPVCVAENAGGLGIFKGLYAAMWRFLPASEYQTGFAFINEGNQRSLNAHLIGLGATKAGSFLFDGERYVTVSYARPK